MKRYPISALLGLVLCGSAFAQPAKIKLDPFLKGLTQPLWVTNDHTPRMIVVEQEGRVRLIINGKLQDKPYLDIVSRVKSGGEMGLLSCVFHPDFATNGYIYVDYTRMNPTRQTVIAEYHVDPKADSVDPSTERILLTIDQPYPNHKGGQLQFGPDDKMLYIGMGDGGSANDPQGRGQNLKEFLAKILRIDVTPREGYGIPKDNPFVGRDDARPEIWAYGVRNPWRFSFDRETHLLYAGDVGQNLWEEVDIIKKGGNYGWNVMEATHDFRPRADAAKDMIPPIKEYPHTVGLSITGGFVYRGKAIPALKGWYVYGDYAKGQIWGLKYEDGKVTGDELLLQSKATTSSFGEDVDGELYLCDYSLGNVFKIVEDK